MTATITPRRLVHHPAWIRFDADTTTLHLLPGHTRRLRHGHDVTGLVLRRAGGEDGAWRLDLVRGTTPVVRLGSADWDFDQHHGPAAAAAASGLPLERTDAASEEGEALAPGQFPSWLTLLLLPTPLLVLGALVLVLADGPAWLAAVLALPAVAWVLAARLLEALPRGTLLLPARPRGSVRRADLRSRLVRTPGGRALCTLDVSRPLPAAGDLLAPTRLHAFRGDHGTDQLALATDDGHALVQLERRLWAPGPAAVELADALEVSLVDGAPPTAGGALPTTWPLHATGLATPWLPLAALLGVFVTTIGIDRSDSADGVAAMVLGAALLALTGLWGAARWVRRRLLLATAPTTTVTAAEPSPNGAR